MRTMVVDRRLRPRGPAHHVLSTTMSRLSDTRRVCRFRFMALPASMRPNKRAMGVYLGGALFAAGWWLFFDACVRSAQLHHPAPGDPAVEPPIAIALDDWVPGLCATIGLVIVNLIDKQHLIDEGGFGTGPWGDDPILWRTRMWLFIGFAFLAGGLAGSLAVLIVKYMLNSHAVGYVEFGTASVLQNLALIACAVLLWYSQRVESDYEYNLTL